MAGGINLALALFADAAFPPLTQSILAMITGLVTHGLSLVLFVWALRKAGAARTGAYFSTAPFIGAMLAVATDEPAVWNLLVAALFMGIGVWLHLTERHDHQHDHEPLLHSHEHIHDDHHIHDHDASVRDPLETHAHVHRHDKLRHKHPHFPEAHHLHRH